MIRNQWGADDMAGRLSLAKVRNLLIAKANEHGNPGATTPAIVDAVMRDHPQEVQEVTDRLLRGALGRELARARNKSPGSIDQTQTTLWANFGVASQILVVSEDGNRLNKNLDICTGTEVRNYVASLPMRRNRSDRKTALLAMLDSMKELCPTEDKPLGGIWQARLTEQSLKAG